VVLEGNRRLAALKALSNPQLVAPVLSRQEMKRLSQLARRYANNPITSVKCV
jgi:hypothetical protein